MGFISAPLLYSKFIHSLKTDQQSAVYRLIKGGFLIIVRHDASPPIPSFAHMDNSHAKVYYELAMNPEKF